MLSRGCALLPVVMLALIAAGAQTSPHQTPPKADYSQEAWIINESSTKLSFSTDGNSTREQITRVLVQTDGGVQQWGLLKFPFQSSTQTVEIDYVRVRKPDGTTVITPPDNVQDLDAEITRSAPFYSDLREKHVAVKGLGKGDILEYKAHWLSSKPLIPGQFWFVYNFQHDGIVLDEHLEVRVPADCPVKVKGPLSTQTITTEPGSRVYSWSYSKLQSVKDPGADAKKETDAARGRIPAPDVQISSFQSWAEVGHWYWSLQQQRVEPTAAIRAKAAELTRGMTDDAAKLQAIYDFVSLRYRYIGIAFGIGRYQPHAAEDVLTNNYGDCKDKHTLLASLLQASGIQLYPALISSTSQLDPDVPSPAQFDHIIGYLPLGKKVLWLDTTLEVSPLGFLFSTLRDKPALVMSGDKSALLITTPADAPFPTSSTFRIDAKLNDDGSLDAKVEDTLRGEPEVAVRSAFRRVPQPQWKDLAQQISFALGYSGTVSDVTASAPEAMTEPFHFSYSYHRKNYPDWSNRQFTVPGLPFLMPTVKDDAANPIWLGSPQEMVADSTVEIPSGYKLQLPANVDLNYDFAEYHASYSQDHRVLTSKRRLLSKLREIPVAELEDYRTFLKNLQNDVNQYVQTSSLTIPSPPNLPVPSGIRSFLGDIATLPDSHNAEANQLDQDARAAMETQDVSRAEYSLKTALAEKDPKFTRGWLHLGLLYAGLADKDNAIAAFNHAIDSDPSLTICHRILAYALMSLPRPAEAIHAWQDLLKLVPDDQDAVLQVGGLLLMQQRYTEAVSYLETAAKNDDSPTNRYRLARAYLHSGDIDKGAMMMEKSVDADSNPIVLNDAAYELADDNVSLPKALEYADRAVRRQEQILQEIKLDNLSPEAPEETVKIGYYWDTIGWVHFRLGHFALAESYLNAAWSLSQQSIVADHLGQVYEAEKKTPSAIQMYRLAISAFTPETEITGADVTEIRKRLARLTPGSRAPTPMELLRSDPNGSNFNKMRLAKLPKFAAHGSAEFFLLFAPGPTLEDVRFISGSKNFKPAEKLFKSGKFPVAFPMGSSARLLRRGLAMCSEVTGCQMVLLAPDSVHSVK